MTRLDRAVARMNLTREKVLASAERIASSGSPITLQKVADDLYVKKEDVRQFFATKQDLQTEVQAIARFHFMTLTSYAAEKVEGSLMKAVVYALAKRELPRRDLSLYRRASCAKPFAAWDTDLAHMIMSLVYDQNDAQLSATVAHMLTAVADAPKKAGDMILVGLLTSELCEDYKEALSRIDQALDALR